MRRLLPTSRLALPSWLVPIVYLAWRSSSSLGKPVARFPDSEGYQILHFIGSNDRFWAVPFVFNLVSTDDMRVIAHIVIGSVAWVWLAYVLARDSRYPLAIRLLTLAVGLSPQVVRYDLAILSESLGISFAVMTMAASLTVLRSRTFITQLLWVTATTLCVMTRPTHLIIVVVLLLSMLVLSALRRQPLIRPATLVMLTVALWGGIQLSGNAPTSTLNFYTVLAERVMPDDDRYAWFVANGMPDIPGARDASGYDFAGDLPPDVAQIIALPIGQQPPSLMRAGGTELATWVVADGWNTYTQYLGSHKAETWQRVRHFARYTLGPTNDDFLPLETRQSFPRQLFGAWMPWGIAGTLALIGTSAIARRQQQLYVVLLAGASTFLVYSATVLTSGIEHQRHAVTAAVMVRVVALAAIATATSGRRTKPAHALLGDEHEQ
jgi:hypothetical protein